jgi:hypothetical protein
MKEVQYSTDRKEKERTQKGDEVMLACSLTPIPLPCLSSKLLPQHLTPSSDSPVNQVAATKAIAKNPTQNCHTLDYRSID